MEQVVNWTEIPVTNLARAKAFYKAAFEVGFQDMDMNGLQYAILDYKGNSNAATLVQGEGYTPSADGLVIYLNAAPDMSAYLGRIASAGGQVIVEKTYGGEIVGYIGIFIDSEGNRIGLHHM